MKKDIILYTQVLPQDVIESVRRFEKSTKKNYRIMLICDSRRSSSNIEHEIEGLHTKLVCDFSKPQKIAETLLPYQDHLLAINCRGESQLALFRDVIPHVPYLNTTSTESIEWSTDKLKMRRRFALYDKKITPLFTEIKENSIRERKRIIKKIGFPMIVKPANLAKSLLVAICYDEEELAKVINNSFRKIKKLYTDNNRGEVPKIMAEEFMDGLMYSVDAYVSNQGVITFCPMVRVKTGRDIGHPDDFFNYLRITPTALKTSSIEKAHAVAEKGVHALGLRNITVHIELMRVDDDWKIIEIGARIGGFRHELHMLSCGIDHNLNDISVRIPRKISMPKKCIGYAATIRWYPKQEGTITSITGLKKIESLSSFNDLKVKLKVGSRCYHSKNGGSGVFDLTMFNIERSQLLADIRRVEKIVNIKVQPRKVRAAVK